MHGTKPFASRKPNLACRTRILFLPSYTHLGRRDQDFAEFLLLSLLLLEFPLYFNRISSTASAVCISKTHLCRFDPDFTIILFYYFTILLFYYFTILLFYYFTILLFYYFTILLFYYFTILLFYYFTNFTRNREFASRKPTCAGWTQNLPLY